MTIDEAIAHAREVAEENRKRIKPKCDYQNLPWIDDENEACEQCAEQHEQLAEWLEELKAMRNLDKTNFSDGYNAGRADAIDEAIKALEKQIPKKVIFVHPLQEDDNGDYMCPTCKNGTVYDAYGNKSPHCHYCGQAIKWE